MGSSRLRRTAERMSGRAGILFPVSSYFTWFSSSGIVTLPSPYAKVYSFINILSRIAITNYYAS